MKAEILKLLKEYTKHKYIRLTSRGNLSIFLGTYFAKKTNSKPYFLIPDQGGWLTYKKYPKMFGFTIKELETDQGVINLDKLKEVAQKCGAFIYANPAGYFAEQPMKEIYEICSEAGCIVILDATGAIGSDMCNGEYADFTIGSFGKWKPVNMGYGGWISSKEQFPDLEMFSLYRMSDLTYPKMLEALQKAPARIKQLMDRCDQVKQDLKDFNVIHADKKGLVVVVGYKSSDEKEKIIEYCKAQVLEFTECPRYIRVEEPAISIEIKRLE